VERGYYKGVIQKNRKSETKFYNYLDVKKLEKGA